MSQEPTQSPPPPPNRLVHFHDLVALIDQKIFEIKDAAAAKGELTKKDVEVIRGLDSLRVKIVDDWCKGDCPSYLYFC